MKYDIEDLMDDLLARVQATLPQKLIDIEAEKITKSKGLTGGIPAPTNSAYYYQAWDNAILNHKVAIFYGVEDVGAREIGMGQTAQDYKIFFEVVITNANEYSDVHKRIHRYSRALREVLEGYANKNSFVSAIKVETVRPISFKLETDTSYETNVGGVSISTSIV